MGYHKATAVNRSQNPAKNAQPSNELAEAYYSGRYWVSNGRWPSAFKSIKAAIMLNAA